MAPTHEPDRGFEDDLDLMGPDGTDFEGISEPGRPGREPGWYADPDNPGHWGWWDGAQWTEHLVSADRVRTTRLATSGAVRAAGPEGTRPEGTRPEGTGAEVSCPEGTASGALASAVDGSAPAVVAMSPPATSTPTASFGGATTAVMSTEQGSGRRQPVPGGPVPSTGSAGAGDQPGGAGGASGSGRGGNSRPGGGRGGAGSRPAGGSAVFARRWAALALVVVVIVVVLVVALRGHPRTLYWQGEPLSNGSKVLGQAESTMKSTVAANEGALSAHSRCYYTLPNRSTHDVGDRLACGPVLFPWSSPSAPWLEYRLSATSTNGGVTLHVALPPGGTDTRALARGTVLRRPDGTTPPKGDAGLAVPAVPRQQAGWSGLLSSPPTSLTPAPVDDVLGGWAHDYRVVAFGVVGHLSSSLDRGALRSATNPKGSSWSIGARGRSDRRPLAELLVPTAGQDFVVAELAESPGEVAGAVPAGAGSVAQQPTLQVLGGTTVANVEVPGGARSTNLYVAASVPTSAQATLVLSDKGLAQEVSLSDGQPSNVPSVLARLNPNESLNLTGRLPGVTVHASDAALVWFAGSDGGTVPPNPNEAYLQVLMSASPLGSSFLPSADFALRLAGGQVVDAQALPDADRTAIVVGFVVPASFSSGTVVVSVGGRSFSVPVDFP